MYKLSKENIRRLFLLQYSRQTVNYVSWSATPWNTELAILKAGSEALVISPGFILELDSSFELESSHMEQDPPIGLPSG